jgi:prolyl 4-hydroxylase
MKGCRTAAGKDRAANLCDDAEKNRLRMNRFQPESMVNFTKTGFLKIRAPEQVFRLIKDFWDTNKDLAVVEWDHPTPYHNIWDAPPTIIRTDNQTLKGGGRALQAAIANAARDALEDWTGMKQSSTSVYGIRIYHNQSILTPHVDRLPLVSSAIINVAQDVDEDWLLEVYDHSGIAHNVSMEPGDMVLYESHSVIHGRPFPLQGKYFANIFVHFEALGPKSVEEHVPAGELNYPPYLIPGSYWENDWKQSNPTGWNLLSDARALVQRGDLDTLRYLGELSPSKLHEGDSNADWQPIHEAARQGFVDIVKFLVLEQGAAVNALSRADGGLTPLAVARKYVGVQHPVCQFLESVGGVTDPNEARRLNQLAAAAEKVKSEL